jgi:hypothetical protein
VAVKIDLIADVKDVIKGTDKIGDALQDVADDLKDVGKEGQKVEDKVSDAFRDMATAADKSGSKMDDSVSDAFRNMGKDANSAGDKIGKSIKDGTDKAGEGLQDMKSESASTAKESAASFDGSADSIIGSFQEIAANAFSGFGPAGAAAGLAMAVGVGFAVTAFQEGAEKAAAMKDKAVSMVDKIAEAGGDLTKMDLSDTIKEWGREVLEDNWVTVWANEASTKFQETAKDAKDFGVSSREAIRAAAGSSADSQKFLDETADDWQRLTKIIDQNSGVNEDQVMSFTDAGKAAQKQRDALADLRGQAEENIKTTADAVDIYNIETDAISGLSEAMTTDAIKARDSAKAKADAADEEVNLRQYVEGTTESVRAAAEATEDAAENQRDLAQYVSGTTEQYQKNADAIERVTDALKGSMTTELDFMDASEDLTKQLAESGNAWDINTAKGRDNQRAVIDIANGIEDVAKSAIEAGTPIADVTAKFNDQKNTLVNQVLPAFQGNREAAQLYIDTILKTPPVAKTRVELDDEAARAKLAELERRRTLNLQILPDGTAVEKYIMSQQGRKIFIDVAPRGGGQALALP